jgi:pre-rRNA-processing protein TSR3
VRGELCRGHSFFSTNQQLLDKYAACATAADVISTQNAWLETSGGEMPDFPAADDEDGEGAGSDEDEDEGEGSEEDDLDPRYGSRGLHSNAYRFRDLPPSESESEEEEEEEEEKDGEDRESGAAVGGMADKLGGLSGGVQPLEAAAAVEATCSKLAAVEVT